MLRSCIVFCATKSSSLWGFFFFFFSICVYSVYILLLTYLVFSVKFLPVSCLYLSPPHTPPMRYLAVPSWIHCHVHLLTSLMSEMCVCDSLEQGVSVFRSFFFFFPSSSLFFPAQLTSFFAWRWQFLVHLSDHVILKSKTSAGC